MRKKKKNVRISFKIINGDDTTPPTYTQITFHMIFDVKIQDFQRKACFFAGGHTPNTPPHAMIYASFLSRDLVRIALTLADLNNLDVKMMDIGNSYLTAPIT
jgi:hypothetical protein